MYRRRYLQTVGASAVSVTAAGSATATEHETGYGTGGYGEGPYGDSSDDSGDDGGDGGDDGSTEIGDPVVEYLSVRDVSPPNPHVELVVEWTVSHPDGELASVDIAVETEGGSSIDSFSHTVSGSESSGTDQTEIKKGVGESYVVSLVVTDTAGTTVSAAESVTTSR